MQPALESLALWQHRDIPTGWWSGSSFPTRRRSPTHVLCATARMVEGFHIDRDRPAASIYCAGMRLLTSRLLSRQLDAGVPRRDAMAAVRRQVSADTVAEDQLRAAVDDLLASEHLARAFAAAGDLRVRNWTTSPAASSPNQ